MNIINYWHAKYPKAKIGLVMSSLHDQIFRLFFAAGANNCATNDPNLLTTLGAAGSGRARRSRRPCGRRASTRCATAYGCTGAFSSYYIGDADPDARDMNGTIDTLHMHIFRDRFYEQLAGEQDHRAVDGRLRSTERSKMRARDSGSRL